MKLFIFVLSSASLIALFYAVSSVAMEVLATETGTVAMLKVIFLAVSFMVAVFAAVDVTLKVWDRE